MASDTVTYGAKGASFSVSEWMASAEPTELAETVSAVSELIAEEKLSIWVENYPVEDFDYARKKVTWPYAGFREMVLKF